MTVRRSQWKEWAALVVFLAWKGALAAVAFYLGLLTAQALWWEAYGLTTITALLSVKYLLLDLLYCYVVGRRLVYGWEPVTWAAASIRLRLRGVRFPRFPVRRFRR